MPPRRNRNTMNVTPSQLAEMIAQAVSQAIQQALPNHRNREGEGNQNGQESQGNQNGQENQGSQSGQGNHGNQGDRESGGGQGTRLEPFMWLERFIKQKPDSFSSAPTPIDAENWIVHLEKIFDALGCDDHQMVKLAVYKLEGDAQRWWRGVKAIKGDAFIETLTWQQFTALFYEQYFSNADRDAYLREFNSIRQNEDESITDYMARFIRLTGFAGTIAGNAAQQAEKFKWGLKPFLRGSIISSRFQNVAEVADAAKDVEKERIDFRTTKFESGRKRGREDQPISSQGRQWNGGHHGQWQGQNQNRGGHSNFDQNQHSGQRMTGQFQQQQPRQWQNRQQGQSRYSVYGGNPNMIPVAPCVTCGGHHPGKPCYRKTGACFLCGSMSHRAKDCTASRNTGGGGSGSGGQQQNPSGRVFALTANQAAENSGTVSGTLRVGTREAYVREKYPHLFAFGTSITFV